MGHLGGWEAFVQWRSGTPLTPSIRILFEQTERNLSCLTHSKNSRPEDDAGGLALPIIFSI